MLFIYASIDVKICRGMRIYVYIHIHAHTQTYLLSLFPVDMKNILLLIRLVKYRFLAELSEAPAPKHISKIIFKKTDSPNFRNRFSTAWFGLKWVGWIFFFSFKQVYKALMNLAHCLALISWAKLERFGLELTKSHLWKMAQAYWFIWGKEKNLKQSTTEKKPWSSLVSKSLTDV